jgi:glycerol kinase
MAVLLAIDAGTTGVRAMMVRGDGTVASRGYREFPQSFPRSGWVEHDPADWWSALGAATAEALERSALQPRDLAGIGITNQRETTVVWHRSTLQPVHPAIVWQDRRTAELCATLRDEGWADHVRDRTGLLIDPYFSGTKVAWILDNVAGARAAADAGELAFGTVDSYLITLMTGGAVHVMDRTNASRTMVFDIHDLRWDGELLEWLRIPTSMLPEVRTSSGPFGVVDPDRYLGRAVPIMGVAGDQQAALFGQACFEAGSAKNTYGTGSFLLMHTGDRAVRSSRGLLTTIAAGAGEAVAYALEGSVFTTGAAIQWLRDGLGLIASAAEAGPLAASVPDTGDVYFVPALAGLGAPWWNPSARGALIGLSRGTTRAQVVRAVVESIAYQCADVATLMREESGVDLESLKVDGGAAAMDLLLQLQADLIGVPVRRAAIRETTALGAAYLAGLAAGVWGSVDDLRALWRADREFEPADGPRAAAGHARWVQAVGRALNWASTQSDELSS